MESRFNPLELTALEKGIGYCRPTPQAPKPVTLVDPALSGMTDLREITLLTVKMTTPLVNARARMIEGRVRMLLVTDAEGIVMGLITARDTDSDRAEKIMEKAGLKEEDLNVADVMTLKGKIQAVTIEDVEKASIGDIILTIKKAGRQHALVVGKDEESGTNAVRGIFSLSSLARQLGIDVGTAQKSTTYDDIADQLQGLLDA